MRCCRIFGNHQDAKICRSKLRRLGNAWNLLVVSIIGTTGAGVPTELAKFSDLLGHTAPAVKLRSKEPNLAMVEGWEQFETYQLKCVISIHFLAVSSHSSSRWCHIPVLNVQLGRSAARRSWKMFHLQAMGNCKTWGEMGTRRLKVDEHLAFSAWLPGQSVVPRCAPIDWVQEAPVMLFCGVGTAVTVQTVLQMIC